MAGAGLGYSPQQLSGGAGAGAGLNEAMPVQAEVQQQTPPPMTMRDRSDAIYGVMNQQGVSQPEALAILGLAPPAVELPPEAPEVDDGISAMGLLPGAAADLKQDIVQGGSKILARITGYESIQEAGDEMGAGMGSTLQQQEERQKRFDDRQQRFDDSEQGRLDKAKHFAGDFGDVLVENAPQLGVSVGGLVAGRLAGKLAGKMFTGLMPGPLKKASKIAEPYVIKAAGAFGIMAPSAAIYYEEGYQDAIEQGLDPSDPKVRQRIETQAGLRTLVETVTPLKILSKFGADAAVKRSLAKAVAKQGTAIFATEGLSEVADMAIQELFLDEELLGKLTADDWAESGPWIAERYGRDTLMALMAGGVLGAGMDLPGTTFQQKATNAKLAEDTKKLANVMEPLGLDIDKMEELSKTEDGVATLKEAVDEIGRSEAARSMQSKAVADPQTDEDKELAAAIMGEANASADEKIDKWAKKLGAPMRLADVKRAKDEQSKAQREAALRRLDKHGQPVSKDIDQKIVSKFADKLDRTEADLESKRTRVEAIADPQRKAEAQAELDTAAEESRAARVEAKMELQGMTYTQATNAVKKDATRSVTEQRKEAQRAGRERAVERQMELEMPETMPEPQRKARAQEIIDEAAVDAKQDKGLDNKLNRLRRQRRAATSDQDIDKLTNEIADLEARRGLPTPAVEAARRVLQVSGEQDQSGATELSPGTEATPAGEAETIPGAAVPESSKSKPAGAPALEAASVDLVDEFVDVIRNPEDSFRSAADMLPGATPERVAEVEAAAKKLDSRSTPDADRAEARKVVEAAVAEFRIVAPITPKASKPKRSTAVAYPDATELAEIEAMEREEETYTALDRIIAAVAGQPAGYDLATGQKYRDLTGHPDQKAADFDSMREYTKTTGNEVGAHMYDGKIFAVGTNDMPNAITSPRAGFGDPAVEFVHTHTVDTPFSASDVRAMLHSGQKFTALLPNGETLRMSPNGGYDPKAEALINDLLRKINDLAPRDLSLIDRARVRQEAMLQLLEINGNLNYDTSIEAMSEPHMEMVNAIVANLEAALPRDGDRVDAGASAAQDSEPGGQAGEDGTPDAPIVAEPDEAFELEDGDEFGDEGSQGVLGGLNLRSSRRDRRPSFNPAKVRQLALDTIEGRKKRGRRSEWYKDYLNGDLSLENIERGLEAAIKMHGFKKMMAIPEIARAMYPDMKLTVADFEKAVRKQSGSTRDGETYHPIKKGSEGDRRLKAALELTNAVRYSGHGAFGRQSNDMVKGKYFGYRTFFFEASDDLKDFVEFKGAENARFDPPVADPNDTSLIKRQPTKMRFSAEAMQPLERTARYLQANTYKVNKAKVFALTADDMISGKAYGEFGFKPEDVARLDELQKISMDRWSDDDRMMFTEGGVKLFKEARKSAEYKLEQLKLAYTEFAAEHGEDGDVGFMYQVDSRGRIYADGSFHPQAGSKIKGLFEHNGVSLADMVEVDNAASGWQVNALIARDHVAAPKLNMGAGQATDPDFKKQDLYTDTLNNMRGLMKRDLAVDTSAIKGLKARKKAEKAKRNAKLFLDGPFREGVKIPVNRAHIKPAIIAVNYGGGTAGFLDVLMSALQSHVDARPAMKSKDAPWGYIADLGYEALRETAPHSLAFQDWAIKSIGKVAAAVEAGQPREAAPRLEISIGLDGRYAEKKFHRIEGLAKARSTADGQLSFKMIGNTRKEYVGPDGLMVPILKKNGEQEVKDDQVEIKLFVNKDSIDPNKTGRAYFANLIQSFDAQILHRAVERYKKATNEAFVTTNHDSFTVPKEHEGAISASVRESMASVMSEVDVPARLYADLMSQAAKYGVEVDIQPFDGMGSYNMDDLGSSSPLFGEEKNGRPDDFVPTYDVLPPSEPFLRAAIDDEPEAIAGQPTPLYVSRVVQNGAAIKAWAEAQGLPVTMPLEKMHVTTTYSTDPVDVASTPADTSGRAAKVTGKLAKFGDHLVLEFPIDALGLDQDHQKYMDAGGSYDFPVYRPHITLNEDAADVSIDGLADFDGEVRLGPEEQRQLNDDKDPTDPGGKQSKPAAAQDPDFGPLPSSAFDQYSIVQDDLTLDREYVAKPTRRENLLTSFNRWNSGARSMGTLERLRQWFVRKVVTDQAGLSSIERDIAGGPLLVKQGMARMTQMLTNEGSRINNMLYYAVPKWDKAEGIYGINKDVKPLAEIFKLDDAKDYDRFEKYAWAKRDEGIIARGKGARIVDDLRDKWLAAPSAADKARYDAMLSDYKAFNNAMLDEAQDSGLLSEAQTAALKEDEDYVPMFRVFDDPNDFGLQGFFGAKGLSHPDPGIKSLKDNPLKIGEKIMSESGRVVAEGGQFGDLIESIQSNAVAMQLASQANRAHGQIYNFMTGNLGHEIETIERKTGIKVRTLKDGEPKEARGNETEAVTFYKNGEKVYWKAVGHSSDTYGLAVALAGLQPQQLDLIDRSLKKFNSFRRATITSTPVFALRSMLRDFGQGYIQTGTGVGKNAAANMRQMAEAFTEYSAETKELMLGAGVGAFHLGGQMDQRAADMRRIAHAEEKTVWDRTQNAWQGWEKRVGATELGVRKAVYDRQIAKGASKADAMYEARNYIDYGRKPQSKTVRRLNYMVLFLNPRIQGNYRMFENTTGDADPHVLKTTGKIATRGLLSLSSTIVTRGLIYTGISMTIRAAISYDEEDEEIYNNLDVAEKAIYMHIPIPGLDGRLLRIPRPFELGTVFGSIPTQIFDSWGKKNGSNEMGRLISHTFFETFSLNPVPEVVKPVVELYMNRSFYGGFPILNESLQDLPQNQQIDSRTSGIAQALGDVISPIQFDHLANGYLGPLGMYVLGATDSALAAMGVVPPKAAQSPGIFGNLPIGGAALNTQLGGFATKTEREAATRFSREFYDMLGQARTLTRGINNAKAQGNYDAAFKLLEGREDIYLMKAKIQKSARTIGNLRKQMSMVARDQTLSKAARQSALGDLQSTIAFVQRSIVEEARDRGVDGDFLDGIKGNTISGGM